MSSEYYYGLERQRTRARDKLLAQSKAIEKRKNAYHKVMFSIEKKSIKAKLALTSDNVSSTKRELKDLYKKARVLKEKYMSQILEWRSKFAILLELTNEMTRARAKEEAICLHYILSTLQQETGPATEKARDADTDTKKETGVTFDGIAVLKDKICAPVFEEYIPAGKKNEMLQAAICPMTGAQDGSDSESSDIKGEHFDKTAKMATDEGHMLKAPWKSHVNAVIKDYKKKRFDELNLHIGEQVTQVLPADNSGMAFGVKRSGLLRKKKGFFPVSHVQDSGILADTRDDRDVKTARTKRNSNNPVLRILDAIIEPKTKISLLQEVAVEDGAKVYDDKIKSNKLLCKKKWLKSIYGIDVTDDEIYSSTKKAEEFQIPTKKLCAKNISPERCVFSKKSQRVKRALKQGVSEHKDLVLEDMESIDRQQDAWTGDTSTHNESKNIHFYY